MMTTSVSNASDVLESFTDVISGPTIWNVEHLILTSLILGVIIVCAVTGNAFVMAAIILEKKLRRVANYLILSLALADFMVGSVVMPISAINEVTRRWFMSTSVCHMWIYMDVCCCTASILSLVAISIDRYRAVRSIDYIRKRTAKQMLTTIACVWLASTLTSMPSVLLIENDNVAAVTGNCMMSQDLIFLTCATIVAFYLPAIVLIIVYAKIFIAIRERILRKRFSHNHQCIEKQIKEFRVQNNPPEMSYSPNEYSASISEKEESVMPTNVSNESDRSGICENHYKIADQTNKSNETLSKHADEILNAKKGKEKRKRKKERKLALTLTIVTGTFIICWLPFFILVTVASFISPNEEIPELLSSITLWLGYCNSLLNPIIYTVFNEDFRTAFKNLIIGKSLQRCRRRNGMHF